MRDTHDVLQRDVVRLPALVWLTHALHDRGELRPYDEAGIRVLRQDELAPALRCVVVATFRAFARGDVRVVALGECLDVAEVDAREERGEGVTALDGGLGRPPCGVRPVRALAALLRPLTRVAGVHDLDPVSLDLGGFSSDHDADLLVHELPDENRVVAATQPGRVSVCPLTDI